MKTTYFKIDRDIQNHWLWQEKPFSKGQAWIDLILLTTYANNRRFYKGEVVERKRGELHTSLKYLSERWGWSRDRVRRFVKTLESDKMLTLNTTPNNTVITIENYDIYQGEYTPNNTLDKTLPNTLPRHQASHYPDTKKERKEYIEKDNKDKNTNISIPSNETVERRLNEFRKNRDAVNEKLRREKSWLWK